MFTRIVVPLDGSDVAELALAPAIELARRLGVALHLIRVVDISHVSLPSMYGYMVDSRFIVDQVNAEMALACEYLNETARTLSQQGLNVSVQIESGLPPSELVLAMKAGDLFVIASHGRSGIARWYLGSVAEQIMRRATVPVIIIRVHEPAKRYDDLVTKTIPPR